MKIADKLRKLGEEALTKEAITESHSVDYVYRNIIAECEKRAELGGTQYTYGSEHLISNRVPFKFKANLEALKRRLEAEGLRVEYKLPEGDIAWLTGSFVVSWG